VEQGGHGFVEIDFDGAHEECLTVSLPLLCSVRAWQAACRPDSILSRSKAGARRRGRRERRHKLATAAERVPPESRRGVARGRRPDRHTPRAAGHRRGGASDNR
jgi:hypothetical protein